MHNIKRRRLTKKNRTHTKKKTGGWQVKKTTPSKTKKTQPKPKITKPKPKPKPSTTPNKKANKKK